MNAQLLEQKRAPGCLSDLALERLLVEEVRAGAERDALEGHLATCGRCRGRCDALAAAPALEPDELDLRRHGVARAEPPRAGRRARWGAAFVGLAAAAAVVLVVRAKPSDLSLTQTPSAGETRTKGGAVALEIVARRADGRLLPVWGGTSLRGGDAVRFIVTLPAPAHVAVVGLDSAGHVSVYAPAEAGAPDELPAGTHEVPGSVVLDETPGEERFVALVCVAPPDRAALVRAGRDALTAAGGTPSRAGRLDVPCQQAGLSILKDLAP